VKIIFAKWIIIFIMIYDKREVRLVFDIRYSIFDIRY
jgi:hypothetical protein